MAECFGFADIVVLLGMLLLSVSLPVATRLVQQNQENRSKAASTNDATYDGCSSSTCAKCSRDECGEGNTCLWGYNGSTSMRCYSEKEKPPTPTKEVNYPDSCEIRANLGNKMCKDSKTVDSCQAIDGGVDWKFLKTCPVGESCQGQGECKLNPSVCVVDGKEWPNGAAICSNNVAYVCKSGIPDKVEDCGTRGCDTDGTCKDKKANWQSCNKNDECLSGFCQLDLKVCAPNDCSALSCGKCDAAGCNNLKKDCIWGYNGERSLHCYAVSEAIVQDLSCTVDGNKWPNGAAICSNNVAYVCKSGIPDKVEDCGTRGCDADGTCKEVKKTVCSSSNCASCTQGECTKLIGNCIWNNGLCKKVEIGSCSGVNGICRKSCGEGEELLLGNGITPDCKGSLCCVKKKEDDIVIVPETRCTWNGTLYNNNYVFCSSKSESKTCNQGKWKTESCPNGCDSATGKCKEVIPVDGACSTAIVNHCVKGDPVDVADISNYYVWICKGINGGITKTCMLAKPVEVNINDCLTAGGYCWEVCKGNDVELYNGDGSYGCQKGQKCCKPSQTETLIKGVCGDAHRTVTTTKPTSGLCKTSYGSTAVAASVSDLSKTWTWSCYGSDKTEKNTVPCFTLRPEVTSAPGVCGDAHRIVTTTKPTSGLCKTTYGNSLVTASVSDLTKTWIWSCYGTDKTANSAVPCYTLRPFVKPVNGVCGGANRGIYEEYPTTGLCLYGKLSDDDKIAADGDYNWRCLGSDGGSDVRCQAGKKTVTVIPPPTTGSPDHPEPTKVVDKKSILKFKVAFLGLKPLYKNNGADYNCLAALKGSKVEVINVSTGKTQVFSNVQPEVVKGELDSKGNQVFLMTLEVSSSFASLDNNNVIKIKGPVHLKQKMCLDKQTGKMPDTVKCNIDLFRDDNYVYDFSEYTLLAGDVNQDGIVNGVDFTTVKNSMSLSDSVMCGVENDLNMDGVVNSLDLSLITNFSLSMQDE